MNPGTFTKPFRSLGLMHVLDKIKFHYQRFQNSSKNQVFKRNHPGIVLPPDYMLFEAFQLDYEKYYTDGRDSAKGLIEILSQHISFENKKILDWGCGPARIIRHLPDLLPGNQVHGTDYNPKTIEWCRKNIPGIKFDINPLQPPTKYSDNTFDVIYGISIFTHLSKANHSLWYDELMRILSPGGILLLTTQGDAFKEKMTSQEIREFDSGQLVVRDKVKEGHRVFSTFHPPSFMTSLFASKGIILQHIPGVKRDWGIEQDTWIVKKQKDVA